MPGSDRSCSDIRVILFDFDGTLADTIPLIVASHRHATRAVLGEALPDGLLLANLGRPLADQMRVFDPARAEELLAAYREHNALHHDDMIRAYPGVFETVKCLGERGYSLGVVTSKGRGSALRGIEAVGLGGLFHTIVTLEDTDRHKPEPDPVLEGLARIGGKPGEAAYVGDSPFDIVAGLGAGVLTVAVTWGPFAAEELAAAGAHRMVGRPEDLLEVFAARSDRAAESRTDGKVGRGSGRGSGRRQGPGMIAGCGERSGAA